MLSQTLTIGWIDASGTPSLNYPQTFTGAVDSCGSDTIAASGTQQLNISFVKANLLLMLMECDQSCTIKTNANPISSDTIALAAGVPFLWYSGIGSANPFAGNVTTTYAINGSTTTVANLDIRSLSTN